MSIILFSSKSVEEVIRQEILLLVVDSRIYSLSDRDRIGGIGRVCH